MVPHCRNWAGHAARGGGVGAGGGGVDTDTLTYRPASRKANGLDQSETHAVQFQYREGGVGGSLLS